MEEFKAAPDGVTSSATAPVLFVNTGELESGHVEIQLWEPVAWGTPEPGTPAPGKRNWRALAICGFPLGGSEFICDLEARKETPPRRGFE